MEGLLVIDFWGQKNSSFFNRTIISDQASEQEKKSFEHILTLALKKTEGINKNTQQQLCLILKFVKAALYAVYTLQHIGEEWAKIYFEIEFLFFANFKLVTWVGDFKSLIVYSVSRIIARNLSQG